MSKKCNKCNSQNPDSAHFCGGCGAKLEYFSNWKLYDASYNTVISNSQYREYNALKREASRPLTQKVYEAVSAHVKENKWWYIAPIGLIVLFFLINLFIPSSSSAPTPKLKRIQIGNKYGVGYDEKHLLLEAKYDSLSIYSYDNQWIILDKANSLYGVAYVTDSITRVIQPTYKSVITGSNGLGILDNGNNSVYVSYHGIIRNDQPYKKVTWPNADYLYKTKILIAQTQDNNSIFLGSTGLPFNGKTYRYIDLSFGSS